VYEKTYLKLILIYEGLSVNFLMKPTDLSALLEEAAVSNEIYGKQYGVTFVCSGIEQSLRVNGNHHRLIEVITNLLPFCATVD
jgi:signal transduction histidine kinase